MSHNTLAKVNWFLIPAALVTFSLLAANEVSANPMLRSVHSTPMSATELSVESTELVEVTAEEQGSDQISSKIVSGIAGPIRIPIPRPGGGGTNDELSESLSSQVQGDNLGRQVVIQR